VGPPRVFANRVVLVSGAASGIGAATARLFAAAGATVYWSDVDESACHASASAARSDDAPQVALTLDVTSEEQWAAALERIVSASGRLDVLVNSAGISHAAPLTEMTLVEWRRVIAINLDGVFLGIRHGIRTMSAAGAGAIVNVSSASGIRAASGASAYSTSKAAVDMLTCAAAKECRDRGLRIRINAVAPAGVRTPMWRGMPFFQEMMREHGSEEAAFSALASSNPSRRLAEPEDVAEAILYLASDRASMITGVVLPIDDGYLL
jgi:NAD(P)-dependent dehydrogenase (short-subunit alcohol dehydrogenase family)